MLAARRDYENARAMIATIDSASRHRADVARTAAAVILALPDSAYLTSLEVNGAASGTLTAAAPRANDLIQALDRSGAIISPHLASQQGDRFTVRFGSDSAR
ncbi:MAG TPA: hypothetical protein VFW66_10580 [Gemmatimonadales bacterium]|nr:hypothetical protein [Gemmatimonadales bacterium]